MVLAKKIPPNVTFGGILTHLAIRPLRSLATEDQRAEQDEVHHDEKDDEDDKRQHSLLGCKRSQQHHGKTEHDGGQILVDQVICDRRLVFGVDLAEQNHTRAGRARQHTVHGHKLLLAIAREQFLCDKAVIPIGRKQTDDAQNEQHMPILLDIIEANGGDTGNDHQVEKEAAHTVHEERIDVLLFDDIRTEQHIQGPFQDGCHQHAEQKIEAVEYRAEAGDEHAEQVHQGVRNHINAHDDGDLNGHFINAAVHGDLVGGLDLLGRQRSRALILGNRDLALFLEDVQMDHAADGRTQKAQCGHGQTEAASADKTVLGFINIAVVECLTGSLSEAKGQKDSACCKEILDNKGSDHGHAHAENALKKVGGNRCHARIEHLDGAAHALAAASRAEGGCDKTERQAMIGDDLHGRHAVAAKEGGIKQQLAGGHLVNDRAEQQNHAAQNRGRNQRNTQQLDGFFEQIGNQKAQKQHRDQADKAPDLRVPKIEVFHTPLLA